MPLFHTDMLNIRALFIVFGFVLCLTVLSATAAPVNVDELRNKNDIESLPEEGQTLEKRRTTYHGIGTWFVPETEGGIYGACGPKENSESMIVAMNHKQYGNMNAKSKWCGKKLRLKGPKGSTTVTVNDACPGCGYGDLDLTPKVFQKVIGDFDLGVGKITWYEI